jgi:virginiamycin A acetyltransferase
MADMICTVIVFPLYLFYWVLSSLGGRDKSFWGFSQFLSLFPGIPGNYLRKNFYQLSMTNCDRDCAILFGTIFSQADTEIGKGVYIGPQCNIGKCRIENDCTLGSGVHIISGKSQHYFDDRIHPCRSRAGLSKKW